jgi:hypothetical protein
VGYNGRKLHRACEEMSSVSDSFQLESSSIECHNPIFTSGIFSGIDTQNEVAQTEPG